MRSERHFCSDSVDYNPPQIYNLPFVEPQTLYEFLGLNTLFLNFNSFHYIFTLLSCTTDLNSYISLVTLSAVMPPIVIISNTNKNVTSRINCYYFCICAWSNWGYLF